MSDTPTPADSPDNFLTVFFGVGGVGKSALHSYALENAVPGVALVTVDFDNQSWSSRSSWPAVAAHLVRRVEESGVPMPLSKLLLSLHEGVTTEEAKAGVDEWLATSASLAGTGVDVAFRAISRTWTEAVSASTRTALRDYGLWPEETLGSVSVTDLERKLSEGMFRDVCVYLAGRSDRNVRVLIDGFDRVQTSSPNADAQHGIEEFLGYCATSLAGEERGRVRVVVFGRETLAWDVLYDDPTWPNYWRQFPLVGLVEADARAYLVRCGAWYREQGGAEVAEGLDRHQEEVLAAARESGQQAVATYSPFHLALAVEHVQRAIANGSELQLWRMNGEARDRYLKYLGAKERRALMVLALAGTFDDDIFDWLAERRVIEYPVQSFYTAIHQNHCYFERADNGQWRFHRLFGEIVLSLWYASPATKREAAKVLHVVLEYYRGRLNRPAQEWSGSEVIAWSAGSEMAITHGLEGKLWSPEEYAAALSAPQWASPSRACGTRELQFRRREQSVFIEELAPEHDLVDEVRRKLVVLLRRTGQFQEALGVAMERLELKRRATGITHEATWEGTREVAALLRRVGRLAESEKLIRKLFRAQRRRIGLAAPMALRTGNELAILLLHRGRLRRAHWLSAKILRVWDGLQEADQAGRVASLNTLAIVSLQTGPTPSSLSQLREVLSYREATAGPEAAETLASTNNLAVALAQDSRLDEAEQLLRRVFGVRRRLQGGGHPDTIEALFNIGVLRVQQGKIRRAIRLCRSTLAAREVLLGQNHPATLASLSSLAVMHARVDDVDGAEELVTRALRGRTRILGSEHPDTLDSASCYASVLRLRGKWPDAVKLARSVLRSRERALGMEHPDTLRSLNQLAVYLSSGATRDEAEQLFRRAYLGAVASKAYRLRIVILKNLTTLLRHDRLHEAREMLFDSIGDLSTAPGQENLLVLGLAENQVEALAAIGRLDEARGQARLLYEARAKALGPLHVDTIRSLTNYADLVRECGTSRIKAAAVLEASYWDNKLKASDRDNTRAAGLRKTGERLIRRSESLRQAAGRAIWDT